MAHWYHRPEESIGDYVRTVLVMKGHFDAASSRLPLFTSGSAVLLCKTEVGTATELTLFGQNVPAEKWETNVEETIIAIFFKPFAIGAIFNVSAKELKESPVPLSLWNPQKAMAVNLQLHGADTMERKVEVLNNLIKMQITANQRECEIIRYATDQIMYDPGTDILARIQDDLKLTERSFQRIFKKYVGVTQVQYRRTCQFYFAFAQLRGKNFNQLTDIAYDNGYFDQSHYIRSFREFAETTPKEYLQSGLPGRK